MGCTKHGEGRMIRLRAREIKTEKSRIWVAINASMELPKVYAAANRLGHSGEMLPQFPCLVLRVQ